MLHYVYNMDRTVSHPSFGSLPPPYLQRPTSACSNPAHLSFKFMTLKSNSIASNGQTPQRNLSNSQNVQERLTTNYDPPRTPFTPPPYEKPASRHVPRMVRTLPAPEPLRYNLESVNPPEKTKLPFWCTKKGIILLFVAGTAIVLAAVLGGVLGSRKTDTPRNSDGEQAQAQGSTSSRSTSTSPTELSATPPNPTSFGFDGQVGGAVAGGDQPTVDQPTTKNSQGDGDGNRLV
ncbi:hypothetical protein D9756_007821 [Leucocoprinus leucothites]|uniref:Uncharacterized protein n=1 Tax=Leucocoprinus leucothites TaxID=201217 RepID=A0A8H5D5X9_9AGAR|nr:hypothetical protein D9756_007821 [Leucoagaricus leucothites]